MAEVEAIKAVNRFSLRIRSVERVGGAMSTCVCTKICPEVVATQAFNCAAHIYSTFYLFAYNLITCSRVCTFALITFGLLLLLLLSALLLLL